MKFSDVHIAEEFPATKVNIYWPHAVIKFYEERLEWHKPTVRFGPSMPVTEDSNGTEGDPQRVLCMYLLIQILPVTKKKHYKIFCMRLFRCDRYKW